MNRDKINGLQQRKQELLKAIVFTREKKKQIINIVQELVVKLNQGLIDRNEYEESLNKVLKGRNAEQWIKYYDDYIKYYNSQIKLTEKLIRQERKKRFKLTSKKTPGGYEKSDKTSENYQRVEPVNVYGSFDETSRKKRLVPILNFLIVIVFVGIIFTLFIILIPTFGDLVEKVSFTSTDVIEKPEIILQGQTGEQVNIIDESFKQYQAVIDKSVKWKLEFETDSFSSFKTTLPEGSEILSVRDENNNEIDFEAKEEVFGKQINLESKEDSNSVEIIYETPSPVIEEISEGENIGEGKKVVVKGPDDVHYNNILSFTELPRELSEEEASKLKLKQVSQDGEAINKNINYVLYDTNENGLYDLIEWITPQLSEAEFLIIIEISKAELLDENKEFVEDVFEIVSKKDDNWLIVPDNYYVRVTFEEQLDNTKDITLYARGNGSVEVYSIEDIDEDNLLIEFEIGGENEYKKYLTLLEGSQDVFDLKFFGDVEVDWIVDPIEGVCDPTIGTDQGCVGCGEVFNTGNTGWTFYFQYCYSTEIAGNELMILDVGFCNSALGSGSSDCANYHDSGDSYDYYCPSYERKGSAVNENDCICTGEPCTSPDYSVFNFSSEFFAGSGLVDTIPPNINFTFPTPADGNVTENNWIFVNISADDSLTGGSNISTFIDFNNSLVGWWRMDELCNGGLEVCDNSSYGNDGSMNGGLSSADIVDGKLGNALEFDGVNDYIEIADNANLNFGEFEDFSITGWFNTLEEDPAFLVIKGDNYLNQSYSIRKTSGDQLAFQIADEASFEEVRSDIFIHDGQWHFFVATAERGGAARLYINGILQTDVEDISNIGNIDSLNNLTIGANHIHTQGWNGSVDDLMIFDRALSENEVLGLYANSSSKFLERDFTDLENGNYTFKAYAQDTSGNVNMTEEREVEIKSRLTSCGDLNEANKYYTLSEDVNSSGTCFNITAENVTLDCEGHMINYSQEGVMGYGVYSNQFNSSVKNCRIYEGDESTSFKHAIYFDSSDNAVIKNNTIVPVGFVSKGVLLLNSNHSTILSNNIIAGVGASRVCMLYLGSSDNANISYNTLSMRSGVESEGVLNLISSRYATLSNNNVSGQNKRRIYNVMGDNLEFFNHSIDTSNMADEKPFLYIFSNNSFSLQDDDTYGQIFIAGSDNSYFKNINLTEGGFFIAYSNNVTSSNMNINSSGVSIWMHYTNYSSITNLTLFSVGDDEVIYLKNSNNNNFSYMDLVSNDWHNPGLFVSSSHSNVFSNANILTDDGNSEGIEIDSSNNNEFYNFTITTIRDVTNGVYISGNSYDNRIIDSSINTNLYGISIDDGKTNTSIHNSVINATLAKDIFVGSNQDPGSFLKLYNVTWNESDALINNDNFVLYNYNYLDVNVTNLGSAVENANVTGFYNNGSYVFNDTTDFNGFIETQSLLEFFQESFLISDCESLSDWSTAPPGASLILSGDEVEGTYSLELSGIFEGKSTTYNPIGTWDFTDYESLNFWVKSKNGSEADVGEIFISSDSWNNWCRWHFAYPVGWDIVSLDINAFDECSGSLDLSSIDAWRFNVSGDWVVLIDNVFLTRKYYEDNYTIDASHTDYESASESVNMSVNRLLNLELIGDVFPPNINFTEITPSNESIINEDNFMVGVNASDVGRGDNNISTFIDFNNSLVGWWRMDEICNGGLEVCDNSSYGNDGLMQGGLSSADVVDGKLGNALEFDGDGDYIGVGNVDLYDNWTVNLWINIQSSEPVVQYPIGFGNPVDSGLFVEYGHHSDNWGLYDGDASGLFVESSNLNEDQWYMLSAVKSGNDYLIYLDGSFENSGILTDIDLSNLQIGNRQDMSFEFNGSIDDALIFNRALSPEEIQGLYANNSEKYVSNNFTNLGDGNYTFKAYAQDTSGNVNMTEEREVEISLSPEILFLPPTPDDLDTINEDKFTINLTANDTNLGDENVSTFIDFNNSLIGWWRMDELCNGGLEVCDVTGKYNATIIGTPSQVDGMMGQGMDFSGSEVTNDSLLIQGIADAFPRTDYSVCWWTNPNAIGLKELIILGNDYTDHDFEYHMGGPADHYLSVRSRYGSYRDITIPNVFEVGKWVHICGTSNNSGTFIYINGWFNQSEGFIKSYTPGNNLMIAAYENGKFPVNAIIDDVMLFKRSITPGEISSIYSNQIVEKLEIDFFNLEDGDYTFTAYAQDNSGYLSQTETRTVTIDNQVPIVDIIYPKNTFYTDTNKPTHSNFSITSPAPIISCLFSDDGGVSNTSISCTQNVTGLTSVDGLNTWTIFAENNLGYTGFDTVSFFVYTAPPNVVIESPLAQNYDTDTNEILFNITNSIEGEGSLVSNLDGSLISWWTMQNLCSGNSICDEMGINNAPIQGNPNQIDGGKFGKGLELDGDDDFIFASSKLNYTGGNMTLAIWAKPIIEEETGYLFSKYWDSGNPNYQLYYSTYTGEISFKLGGLTSYQNGTNENIRYGEWNHLVMTVDSLKNVSIYQDGVRIFKDKHDINDFTSMTDSNNVLQIGRNWVNGEDNVNGTIDDAMIFNRTLTDEEVLALYNATNVQRNLTINNGTHSYGAFVQDLAGNIGSDGVDFSVNFAGHQPFIINWTSPGADSPTPCNSFTKRINVSISDLDDDSNLNSAFVDIYVKDDPITPTVTIDGSCSLIGASINGDNFAEFECIFDMEYYYNPGTWYVEINASDNDENLASNNYQQSNGSSEYDYFSYLSQLYERITDSNDPTLPTSTVEWGSLNVASFNEPADTYLIIENCGNVNISNLTTFGSNLTGVTGGNTDTIDIDSFSVSVNPSPCGNGMILSESVQNISQSNISKSLFGESSNKSLYFCVESINPTGTPPSTDDYETSTPWDITGIQFVLSIIKFVRFNFEFTILLAAVAVKRKKRKLKKNLKKGEKRFEIKIPVSIFSSELHPAEALCKYLKEDLKLRVGEISKRLNRDEATINLNYKNSKREDIKIKEEKIFVDIEIFSDRRLSVLEAVVNELRKKGYKNIEIAEMLGKDQRNIYTLYNRGVKKLKKRYVDEEILIPIDIFKQGVGGSGILYKYLRENIGLGFNEIARVTRRGESTVWMNYRNVNESIKGKIKSRKKFLISVKIFTDRKLSILESLIRYLKDKGYKNIEIAEMLGKDPRNISTLYSRINKKLKN